MADTEVSLSEAFLRKATALDDAVVKIAELEDALGRIAVHAHPDSSGTPKQRLGWIRRESMEALGKGHLK